MTQKEKRKKKGVKYKIKERDGAHLSHPIQITFKCFSILSYILPILSWGPALDGSLSLSSVSTTKSVQSLTTSQLIKRRMGLTFSLSLLSFSIIVLAAARVGLSELVFNQPMWEKVGHSHGCHINCSWKGVSRVWGSTMHVLIRAIYFGGSIMNDPTLHE